MTGGHDTSALTSALVESLAGPVGLAGCGVEGRETLRFLRAHGVRDIRVFDRDLAAAPPPDLAELPIHGDSAWLAELPRCRTVIRSPGIRPDHPALEAARRAGARITSATALFLGACPGPVVGVTGTLGKGTTATLIHEALCAAGLPSRLGGNIGLNPLAFLHEIRPGEPVVLELSSFQTMDLVSPQPRVAVVLRTSEDHLDWHRDVEEYHRAKAGLLAAPGAGQTVIYCADAPGSGDVVAARREGALAVSLQGPVRDGIGVEGSRVLRYRNGGPSPLPSLERLALPGRFNLENAAAALLAAEALGADVEKACSAIAAFPGLPHRLERVGNVRGVDCFNDSYATRPDATLGALGAFDRPLALILGGSEKHANFTRLAESVCRHGSLKRVMLIGATAERLAGEIAAAATRLALAAPPLFREPGLPEACRRGIEGLPQGGVLLLSPACASFGLFPNYKVRGEKFKEWVRAQM